MVKKENIYIFGLTLLLILGGMPWIKHFYGLLSLIFIVFLFFASRRKNFKFHKDFRYLLIFILVIITSLFWTVDSTLTLESLFLYISSFCILLLTYNLNLRANKVFYIPLVLSGLFFALIFVFRQILIISNLEPWSLYGRFSGFSYHYLLGDYWGIIIVYVFSRLYVGVKGNKETVIDAAIILAGFVILFLSNSRSAFLSLITGSVILLLGRKNIKFSKYLLLALLVSIVGLILNSLARPLITARPYFFQGLEGLIKYPYGIGMGNFGKISAEFCFLGCANDYSTHAMNLIIEVFSGAGILALAFLIFLVKTSLKVLNSSDSTVKAIYTAITVNFMFDPSYNIASIFWLWSICIGFTYKNDRH